MKEDTFSLDSDQAWPSGTCRSSREVYFACFGFHVFIPNAGATYPSQQLMVPGLGSTNQHTQSVYHVTHA